MTTDEKFYRTELLLGAAAMERLRCSTVAIFGLGGVGSYAAEALARTGVGHLVLIDHDVVDVTNINRQLHATTKTVGQSKTVLMKVRISEINPSAKIDVIDGFYLPSNGADDVADKFFIDKYDCVVDAIDTIGGKIGLAVECERRGIALVSSMGAGNKLDPTAFRTGDIFETTVDPIAKVMRKKLKEVGIKKLRVVYSTEPPIHLNSTVERKVIGSVSFVPSVAGLILAGEAIKLLVRDLA